MAPVLILLLAALLAAPAAHAAPAFTPLTETDRHHVDRRYVSWAEGAAVRVHDTKTAATRSFQTPEGCTFRHAGGGKIGWQCTTDSWPVARILDVESGRIDEIPITWNSRGGLSRVGAHWAAIEDPDPYTGFAPGDSYYRIGTGERYAGPDWSSPRHALDLDRPELYRRMCSPVRRLEKPWDPEVWEDPYWSADYAPPFARVYDQEGGWHVQRCGSSTRRKITNLAQLRAGWLTWAKRGTLHAVHLPSKRSYRWAAPKHDPETELLSLEHTTRRLVLAVLPRSQSGPRRVYTAPFPR